MKGIIKAMTKEEYNQYYNRKFVGLSKEEEIELDKIFKKISFSDIEKKILNAFYIPNRNEHFPSPDIISPVQMKAELKNLFVLLKCNYCGYDYFNRNQELDRIHEKLKEIIDSYKEPIKTDQYFSLIINELHTVIKDNHFSLVCNNKRYELPINKAPYFSDIVVEEREGKYFVINDNEYFNKGYLIKDNIKDYLFETLSYNENKAFLVGVFQNMEDPIKNITIDNAILPLHLSKSFNIKLNRKNELVKHDDYNMIILTMCHINDEYTYDKYREWGEELKEGQCSVISVANNPGGSSNVCSQIISALNGNGIWNVDCSTLNLFQNTGMPFKYYTYYSNSNHEGGTYDKNLYILMNKYTASAGESLVSISNNVKKTIKVGTNTMGCGFFGEVMSYVLPQTHATINISYKAFFMEGFEEGTGFMPDIWMDDENMIDTFTKWLDMKVKTI